MKNYSWILVVAAVAPLFPLACGGGTTSTSATSTGAGGSDTTSGVTTGSNTTTGSHTTTGSNTTTSGAGTTTSGAGGGTGDCTTIFPMGACDTCGEANCCAEGATCNDTAGCADCLGDATKCDATNKDAHDALITCLQASCKMDCFSTPMPPDATCTVPAAPPSGGSCVTLTADIACNPVTRAPCKADESCDFTNMGTGYQCYPPPNAAKLCGACSASDPGPFCGNGTTCDNGICVKFCCTDADCGAGKCDTTKMFPGGAGECLGGNGMGTGSSSAASSSASSSAAGSSSSTGP